MAKFGWCAPAYGARGQHDHCPRYSGGLECGCECHKEGSNE